MGSAINTIGKFKTVGARRARQRENLHSIRRLVGREPRRGLQKQSLLRQPQTLCSRKLDQWDVSFALALTEPRIAPKEKNSVPWSLSMTRLAYIHIHPLE